MASLLSFLNTKARGLVMEAHSEWVRSVCHGHQIWQVHGNTEHVGIVFDEIAVIYCLEHLTASIRNLVIFTSRPVV